MAELSESEVRKRLESYDQAAVTDELYDFGRMILQDAIERIAKLDGKASTLVAYSGALTALLVSTAGIWSKTIKGVHAILPITAVIALILSAGFAIHSVSLQLTEWFSESEWMESSCLSDSERLRRYRILTMWGVVKSHQHAARQKMRRFNRAQRLMLIAWFLLASSLLDVAWRMAAF